MLEYQDAMGHLLAGIHWKDINQKFKNDFNKTMDAIFATMSNEQQGTLQRYATQVAQQIALLDLNLLGEKQLPPAGY